MSDSNSVLGEGLHAIERPTGEEIGYNDWPLSHCTPWISQSTTTSLQYCGISDLQYSASPRPDGCFSSDFWLLYHLLGPACMSCHGTCCLTVELTVFIMIGTGSSKQFLAHLWGAERWGNVTNMYMATRGRDVVEVAGNLGVVSKELLLNRFIEGLE